MGLLDRVARLVRANLNELIDRAEDPQKMMKQVMLDMQNQLIQVKTQVAIAIADQHLLAKKHRENADAAADLLLKAGISVEKGRDGLARLAVERSLSHQQMAEGFAKQLEEQKLQSENLKLALRTLENKLTEAQAQSELLTARQRRARSLSKATDARVAMIEGERGTTLARMQEKVYREESLSAAKAELAADDVDDQLQALGREDRIEQILREIKDRKGAA